MKTTLYIFIDESGNETQGDYYVVSSCWCVSDKRNFTEVLDPTVQRLTDVAESALHNPDPVSELKGASLPNEVIEAVVNSFDNVPYSDSTVPHHSLPWKPAYPLRFNISTINPKAATEAVGRLVGDDLEGPKTIKLLMLISVLDPLFRDSYIDHSLFDDVSVVLDAAVWKNPAAYAQRAFTQLEDFELDVSFSTEDSVRVPGLQLADISAYSWARNLRQADCEEIVKVIDRHCFSEV